MPPRVLEAVSMPSRSGSLPEGREIGSDVRGLRVEVAPALPLGRLSASHFARAIVASALVANYR